MQLQRRVDQGGSTTATGSSGGTSTTGKGAPPSDFEPYTDAEVWEGQSSPLRIQLDPQTFVAVPSSTAAASSSDEFVSSAGPINYCIKTDAATPLLSWLKFDTSTLEFSGTPPVGTYKRTTILTITIAASSVPGYTQTTDRFTIKVHVHSLSLSISPLRSCSSSNLYYSQEWDRLWQSYLPDLVLDHQQRHINFQLGAELFRVNGCSQPARTAAAAAAAMSGPVNGEVFNVDLLPAILLSYPVEVTVLPIEHKFLFEPVDTATHPQVNLTVSSITTITRLSKNPVNPLVNTTGNHTSSCTYTDLWGQQGKNNREAGTSPMIPNWFNRTSFTSNLPTPSSTTTPISFQEGKVELQGHIPLR
ncbi:hypothetical protein BGW39_003568 [Mortierella sp. 14UC]|nr:hypothetical protein BGW39_003568 [Mortierella sp. 14UC]